MRRSLIAIFALHFFLSVGLFAFGKIDTIGTEQAGTSSTAIQFAGSDHPVQSEGLMGVAPDHALTDGQADLPEVLAVAIGMMSSASTALHPAPPSFVKLIYPTIEGPRRPPKHAATTV